MKKSDKAFILSWFLFALSICLLLPVMSFINLIAIVLFGIASIIYAYAVVENEKKNRRNKD